MTVHSGRKFPLPFSSLETKSANRTSNTPKASDSLIAIETPQTATQNARQHVTGIAANKRKVMVNSPTSEKHPKPQSISRHVALERTQVNSEHSKEKIGALHTDHHKKKLIGPNTLDAPRRAMVARLVKQGIKDELVLAAMGALPRHHFIEPGLVGQAYIDASLPIGHQQTISQPYIVARMIEVMRNGRKLHNVLEIGTGCGYQAAVLAQLCETVYSIERIKLLHELAKKNLRALRIANLRLHYGDGKHGIPQVAPFDGIILAAAGMQIPDTLLQQLAIGGRLIAPVGEKQQVLQLIERTGNAEWTKSVLEECYFVPLCSGTI